MKNSSFRTLPLCLTLAALLAGAGPLRAAATDGSKNPPDGLVAAQEQTAGQSAQKLIGQDVRNTAGDGLGQVKDLVIDARAGQIVYALVGSGGLLGVGEKIRAVPFAAFRDTQREDGDLVLAVERTAWDKIPALRKAEVDTLLTGDQSNENFSRFGLDWATEMNRLGRPSGSDEVAPKMMRVNQLTGHTVVNAGQDVGRIEDIILNLESRRASVLLDPNDDYTGSDQKFIVHFSQLSPSLDQPEKLTTPLTRAEFARALPMQREWWRVTDGYPYIWTGYSMVGGPSYAGAVTGTEMAMGAVADRQAARATPRPALSVIREAVRRDDDLAAAARELRIEERGETLVISGTVPSEEVKRRVGSRLAELAVGWQVDNQLAVRSVGE